jgi:hypothetical protein
MSYTRQVLHNLWSSLDELGLLLGLERNPNESNDHYIERLKSRMKNPPSSTPQGLINALSVEFDLKPYNVAGKSIFFLTHRPENLDRAYTGFTDWRGNAMVNGDEEYGTLRVTIDGSNLIDGTTIAQYVDVTEPFVPAGWRYPFGSQGMAPGGPNFDAEVPGFIIWRDDNGHYTNILQFIFYEPPTGSEVRIEYVYKDDDGNHVYHADYSHPDNPNDTTFIGKAQDQKDPASQIRILTPDELPTNPGSVSRKEIAEYLSRIHGLTWDTMRWEQYHWGDFELSGSGSIEHIYDAYAPSGYHDYMGGTYDSSLLCEGIDVTPSTWLPNINPGIFFLGNEQYYLYRKRMDAPFELSGPVPDNNLYIEVSGVNWEYPITVVDREQLPEKDTPTYFSSQWNPMYVVPVDPDLEDPPSLWAFEQVPNLSPISGILPATAWAPSGNQYWVESVDWTNIPTSGVVQEPPMAVHLADPSGSWGVVVSYDDVNTSGYYVNLENDMVDINPTHSFAYHNKMLIIEDDIATSGYIQLFTPRRTAALQQDVVPLYGQIVNNVGAPLSGHELHMLIMNASGELVDSENTSMAAGQNTEVDGTVYYRFRVDSIPPIVYSPMTFILESRSLDIESNPVHMEYGY